MESNRSLLNLGRRLTGAYDVQSGSVAVMVKSSVSPTGSSSLRRRSESAEQRLAGLEALRRPLVRAVLDARDLCERTAPNPVNTSQDGMPSAEDSAEALPTPTFGQLLLCAAVKDLEELDDRLYHARTLD